MGWILAIDTSSRQVGVALGSAEQGCVLTRCEESQHGDRLGVLVAQALAELEIAAADLSGLVVGLGPGSFTGLRIGLAFQKGLALALRIPLAGVSSLRALASAINGLELVASISDARRGELFLELYRRGPEGELELVQGSAISAVSELASQVCGWADRLGVGADATGVVVTPGSEAILTACDLSGLRIFPAGVLAAGLLSKGCQVAQTPLGGFVLEDLVGLMPNYQRAVAALTIAERAAAKCAIAQMSS